MREGGGGGEREKTTAEKKTENERLVFKSNLANPSIPNKKQLHLRAKNLFGDKITKNKVQAHTSAAVTMLLNRGKHFSTPQHGQ